GVGGAGVRGAQGGYAGPAGRCDRTRVPPSRPSTSSEARRPVGPRGPLTCALPAGGVRQPLLAMSTSNSATVLVVASDSQGSRCWQLFSDTLPGSIPFSQQV